MVDSLTLKYEVDHRNEAGDNLRPELVAFSPQGDLIAVVSDNNHINTDKVTLRVIRLATGELEFEIKHRGARIDFVGFHPQSELMATSSSDKKIRLIGLPTGELERELMLVGSHSAIAFHPEDSLIAAGFSSGMLRISMRL